MSLDAFLALKHRPEIVCLCGSMRFKEAFERAQNDLTTEGKIVLTVGSYTLTDEEQFGHLPAAEFRLLKARFGVTHLFKVQMADRVHVLNVGGYIGESTEREIEYAKVLGKEITYEEAHGQG